MAVPPYSEMLLAGEEEVDFFAVLGLQPGASHRDVTAAYVRHHPDSLDIPGEWMSGQRRALQVLTSPSLRELWEQKRATFVAQQRDAMWDNVRVALARGLLATTEQWMKDTDQRNPHARALPTERDDFVNSGGNLGRAISRTYDVEAPIHDRVADRQSYRPEVFSPEPAFAPEVPYDLIDIDAISDRAESDELQAVVREMQKEDVELLERNREGAAPPTARFGLAPEDQNDVAVPDAPLSPVATAAPVAPVVLPNTGKNRLATNRRLLDVEAKASDRRHAVEELYASQSLLPHTPTAERRMRVASRAKATDLTGRNLPDNQLKEFHWHYRMMEAIGEVEVTREQFEAFLDFWEQLPKLGDDDLTAEERSDVEFDTADRFDQAVERQFGSALNKLCAREKSYRDVARRAFISALKANRFEVGNAFAFQKGTLQGVGTLMAFPVRSVQRTMRNYAKTKTIEQLYRAALEHPVEATRILDDSVPAEALPPVAETTVVRARRGGSTVHDITGNPTGPSREFHEERVLERSFHLAGPED